MSTSVVITGGTGFIGKYLVRKLISKGHTVKCLVRKEIQAAFLKELGVELTYGDVLSKETLMGLTEGTEVVFHLAGIVSVSSAVRDPTNAFMVNTLGTLNLLESLRSSNNNCSIIYLSSDRVYGSISAERVEEGCAPQPVDPYGASKLCAEHLCRVYYRTYDIPFVILRAATVYGAGQESDLFIPSLIRKLTAGKGDVEVGNLEIHKNFVYVEDMVNALYLTFLQREKASGEIFNISERLAKVREVADVLLNLNLKYLGKIPRLVQSPSLVRRFEMANKRCELDSSKAREVLGWAPETPLEEGLEKTFKSFLEARDV